MYASLFGFSRSCSSLGPLVGDTRAIAILLSIGVAIGSTISPGGSGTGSGAAIRLAVRLPATRCGVVVLSVSGVLPVGAARMGPLNQKSRCLGILDGIAVALLRQEKLAVGGELLVARITGDDSIKVRWAAI